MYHLIIDGDLIASDDAIKPLIERLDIEARSDPFRTATIVTVDVPESNFRSRSWRRV